MKTPLLYFNCQRNNRWLSFWGRNICTILLVNLSLTAVTFAQNKVWDKTFGGDKDDELTLVLQTSDGGYILGGTSSSGKSGDKSQASRDTSEESYYRGDYWVVKLKPDGTKAWDKTFGGNDNDQLTALQQTSDGGYILGGTSASGKSGDKSGANKGNVDEYGNPSTDYWVVKLKPDGTKAWDKTFGGNDNDQLTALQQTSDGGYILGGASSSGISGDKNEKNRDSSLDENGSYSYDYWVVKLKASGTKEWDKTIGGRNYDELTSLQQTKDGAYILGGSSYSGISGDKTETNRGEYYNDSDYWVVKLNVSGTKAWDKTIGGEEYDKLTALQQTSDGGYVLGGYSNSETSGDKSEDSKGDSEYFEEEMDYWVVKLKADGTKAWDNTIGGYDEDRLTSLHQTKEGGYILAGYSNSEIGGDKGEDSGGYWVVKLKADGTWIWDKTIEGNSNNDYLPSVKQTSDGGYILGGSSYSDTNGTDYLVVKLGNSGVNLNQIITFGPIADKGLNNSPFTLSATSTSGLPVTFSIVSGPATVKGNTITLTGLGTVTVKASQAGNATYKPATATQTFEAIIPYSIPWDKTIGGDETDDLTAMVSTPDGGYLMGGTSTSGKSGDKSETNKGTPDQDSYNTSDYWIVKTDKTGKKVWDKTFGGSGEDKLTALVATTDGGYLLGGRSTSPVSGDKSQASKGYADYWVIKINANGVKLWDKTIGGDGTDDLTAMVTTPDGGYLLGGSSSSGKSGDKSQADKGNTDYWVVKIDGNGSKLWDKTYGGSNADELTALITTPNGGYLLGGTSASGISGDKSHATRAFKYYWIIQINANGSKAWDKTFGGTKDYNYEEYCFDEEEDCVSYFGASELTALVATPDGGFLLGGSSNAAKGAEKSEGNVSAFANGWDSYLSSYWIVKIDSKGNTVWDKTYGGTSSFYSVFTDENFTGNSELKSIVATSEGNFLLAGSSDSEKGGDKSENNHRETDNTYDRYDYWVVQIDGNGNKLWDKTIGGYSNDYLAVALSGTAGNYILAGSSNSGKGSDKSEAGYESYDYWIVNLKVDETPASSAWNLRYGGSGTDNFTVTIETADGGYLSGGYSNSGNSGDKTQNSQGKNDYWIVKSDKNGQKLWDKRYGGTGQDYLNRVIQTADGGYLLGGSSLSGISGDKTEPSRGDRDYWVVKVDALGNKQWNKRFGGSGYDELEKVIQLATGEYVLGGYSNSPVSGDKTQASQGGNDYWLVKVSSTGTKLWDKRYGGANNETLGSFTEAKDGGFLLGGTSFSKSGGDKSQANRGGSDYWVVKTDKAGNLLWDKTYGGSGQDEAYSVGRSGNDFFISGTSNSGISGEKSQNRQGGKDYWLVKINSTGDKLWDKRFGGSNNDELRASTSALDGGYVLAGSSFSGASGDKTQSNQGGSDYWVVQVDKDGQKVSDQRYGGSGTEELRTVFKTADGGLLLGGRSDSGVSGDRSQPSQGSTDYWLVKVAPLTSSMLATREATLAEEAVTKIEQISLQAYPNPFAERATVNFTLPEMQTAAVKVYDSQGREVATLFQGEAQANQVYQLEWKAGNQAAGMYLLQLQTPTKRSQQKLLLTR